MGVLSYINVGRKDMFSLKEVSSSNLSWTTEYDPEPIFLDIVGSIKFDSPNSIVTYESIGGEGGYSIPTGRLTQKLTINARLISNVPYGTSQNDPNKERVYDFRDSFTENLRKLEKLKNIQGPVYIYKIAKGGANGNFFGKFLIESIDGNVEEGDRTISVTINLIEYKKLKVDTSLILTGAQRDPTTESTAVAERLRSLNYI